MQDQNIETILLEENLGQNAGTVAEPSYLPRHAAEYVARHDATDTTEASAQDYFMHHNVSELDPLPLEYAAVLKLPEDPTAVRALLASLLIQNLVLHHENSALKSDLGAVLDVLDKAAWAEQRREDELLNTSHEMDKAVVRAMYDTLTGLPNKAGFQLRVEEALMQYPNCILLLRFDDLTNFKQINDTYGHDYGDIVLQSYAQNLQREFRRGQDGRPGDLIAAHGRPHGDEFYGLHILGPDHFHEVEKAVVSIGERVRGIREHLIMAMPELDDFKNFDIATGFVVYDRARSYPDNMARVDRAMYAAKEVQHKKLGAMRSDPEVI